MSFEKLSDLLPVDHAGEASHAYQIFGLPAGEQDVGKIAAAVKATVDRLRSVKSKSPPAIWKQAAELVHSARVTLADPAKKAELDARFGIIAVDTPLAKPTPATTPTSSPPGSRKIDPLAGFLPPANPMAPVISPAASTAPTPSGATPATPSNATPSDSVRSTASLFGSNALAGPVSAGPESSSPRDNSPTLPSPTRPTPTHPTTNGSQVIPTAPLVRADRPTTSRRRRSNAGTFLFATFMLGMLAAIAMLGYFLFFGPGTLAITSTDGKLTLSTGPAPRANESMVSPPRPIDHQARERDAKFEIR